MHSLRFRVSKERLMNMSRQHVCLSVTSFSREIVLPPISGYTNWYHTHRMWRKERFWNFCVLCRVHLRNLFTVNLKLANLRMTLVTVD
jgi:hypothetical protein